MQIQKRTRTTTRLGVVALLLVVVVAGIGSASATGATKQASGPSGSANLSYDFTFQGGMNFDPWSSSTSLNVYLQHLVNGGLFWYNQDGSLRPDLATGYTVVSPSVFEVTLRPNLTFQDGSPLTATEVKAQFERMATSPSVSVNQLVRIKSLTPAGTGGVQSVEALSPTKLRFTMVGATAGAMILNLANLSGVIVNPKQFNDPNLKTAPIGAGPYKIVSYAAGQSLKLTASDSYWDAKNTSIKDLTYLQNAETGTGPTQGINRVTTGEIDYFNAYFADTASVQAAGKGDIKAVITPSQTQYTWFNICKNPFKSLTSEVVAGLADLNVRTAMNLMIDRDGLNKSLFGGLSQPRTQNWLKGSPFYSEKAAKAFTYDPKKAKAAMAKSAYPNGFEFTVVNNSTPISDRIAQYLQQQWSQLGIKMNVITSLNIAVDWFQQLKGPAVQTNFIGIDSYKLISTVDEAAGTNNACGWKEQQPFVDAVKAAPPDALKSLKSTWQASAENVAATQSEIMTVWNVNQALYNTSKITKLAIVLDFGREQFDPTRSEVKAVK